MEQRLSCITLGVADLQRSLAFYEALGWAPAMAVESVAFFQAGGLVVSLFPELADDAGVEPEGRGPGLIALAHNVREPEEVDRLLAQAELAGARITRPAHDAFWGGRTGYFTDPDGHLWEVAWNPAWTLDEEGRVEFSVGAAQ